MDVFSLHQQLIGDYVDYTRSFIRIADSQIRAKVDGALQDEREVRRAHRSLRRIPDLPGGLGERQGENRTRPDHPLHRGGREVLAEIGFHFFHEVVRARSEDDRDSALAEQRGVQARFPRRRPVEPDLVHERPDPRVRQQSARRPGA